MSTYGWIGAALAATFLLLFGLVEWLEVEPLRDPSALLASGGWSAALLGVGLLVADVLIPVPASLVMIANGAAYGILAGAALSLLGSVGATWLRYSSTRERAQ